MRNDGYQPFEEFFPNQFKTPLSTLVWTAVYLANGFLLYWLISRLGLDNNRFAGLSLLVVAIAAALLFWVEARVYDKIRSLFR